MAPSRTRNRPSMAPDGEAEKEKLDFDFVPDDDAEEQIDDNEDPEGEDDDDFMEEEWVDPDLEPEEEYEPQPDAPKSKSQRRKSGRTTAATTKSRTTRGDEPIDITSESEDDVPARRRRGAGPRRAIPKKIGTELDSDDEIIISMKKRAYSDKQIADFLKSQGRINYDKRTIASRNVRIQAALQEQRDELLEDDLTDWHEGEDDDLVKAVEMANDYVEREIVFIKERRFKYASKFLKKMRPETHYSAKACKNRFQDVTNGTAKIPPELDDDPIARNQAKQERVLQKAAEKAAKKMHKDALNEAKKRAEEEAQMKMLHSRRALAEKRARDAAEKAQRMQERAAKQQAKAERAEQYYKRNEAQLGRLQDHAENRLLEQAEKGRGGVRLLTGVDLGSSTKRAASGSPEYRGRKATRLNNDLFAGDAAEDEERQGTPEGEWGGESNKSDSDVSDSILDRPRKSIEVPGGVGGDREGSVCESDDSNASGTKFRNPRGFMTIEELQELCMKRDVRAHGSKAQMIKRLSDADLQLTSFELKKMLRKMGEQVAGRKDQLVVRLAQADAHNSAWGRNYAALHENDKKKGE